MLKDYDKNNIFNKILQKEIESVLVYEDEDTVAFMDVLPQATGHFLVIPKTEARNIFDVNPEKLAKLILIVQKLSKAAKDALKADGITIMQFNEPAAGQSVFHLHFHIIPRFEGEPLKPHQSKMEDIEVLKEHANKIKAALTKKS